MCSELNAHLLLNLVYNVASGVFPPEALRIWCCGSQGCEQLFRILRAMTPTFSTIVNFTMQGILNRIHKLHFLSSAECDNEITFPRVQKRLLQINEESSYTLSTPTIKDITETIFAEKSSAIELAESCGMHFDSYDDRYFLKLKSVKVALQHGIENDGEVDDEIDFAESQHGENVGLEQSEIATASLTNEEIITIKEDLSQIKLRKIRSTKNGLPTYKHMNDLQVINAQGDNPEVFKGKEYAMSTSRGKSKFVLYNGVYVRKTTALYLVQESTQLSVDRLLRVRAKQPDHVHGSGKSIFSSKNKISSGDLCLFKRVDCNKCLIGRVVQFSYLTGNKRQRQFSNNFVDLSKDSVKNIGVFANWFSAVSLSDDERFEEKDFISFKSIEVDFTCGYIAADCYIATIDETVVMDAPNFSFSIPCSTLKKCLPNWRDRLSFDL